MIRAPIPIERALVLDLLDLLKEIEASRELQGFLLQEVIRMRQRLEDAIAEALATGE